MRQFILLSLLSFGMAMPSAWAQKIGYLDLQLVLAYMPETEQMNKQLATYEQKLVDKLRIKNDYFQTKGQEYQELSALPNPPQAEIQAMEQELRKLQQELQQDQQTSQNQLVGKRQEMLQPILIRLQSEIKALAEEEGYAYILNASSNGTSIILHGTEGNNVTEAMFKRLNIALPAEEAGE